MRTFSVRSSSTCAVREAAARRLAENYVGLATTWSPEARRGLLIATYMGRWNSEVFTGEPWDEGRVGMNTGSSSRSANESLSYERRIIPAALELG
jgi:hypothetical protein